ncbi:hypothetical protein F383_37303 [Gossypium arboreum]|uniref:Uncharacterized protein n=1 Tax=Gossypium arboreum TaxID=29729 RepID=A0A0B0MC41_GOSAR|nr:hypothetical protein F383_37303 [Gossypium arboreum]
MLPILCSILASLASNRSQHSPVMLVNKSRQIIKEDSPICNFNLRR